MALGITRERAWNGSGTGRRAVAVDRLDWLTGFALHLVDEQQGTGPGPFCSERDQGGFEKGPAPQNRSVTLSFMDICHRYPTQPNGYLCRPNRVVLFGVVCCAAEAHRASVREKRSLTAR